MPDAVNRDALLAQVAALCRRALADDPAARELATGLGLNDGRVLERYAVGYAGHAFASALPAAGGVRQALAELGLLDHRGTVAIAGCLVIPVSDPRGLVIGLAAVAPDGTERLYPPDVPLHGLSPRRAASCPVVTTDTVVGALRLIQAGARDVLAINTAAAVAEGQALVQCRPAKAYVARGAHDLLAAVQAHEVPCYVVGIGPRPTLDDVRAAMDAAEAAPAPLAAGCVARVLDGRVEFDCGGRLYQLRDLDPRDHDRLRVRLRAVAGSAFHLDTLDLYSAVARTRFAGQAAGLLGCEAQAVEVDLMLVIRKLESIREADRRQSGTVVEAHRMTADEDQAARDYLRAPDLLERVVADMAALGYVGEDVNKRLGLLITVSRKLESPLSAIILSRAGAGKSRLMEVLAEMLPPEDLVSFTRLTPQALYYAARGSLSHKVLMAAEGEGLDGAEYPLRELISSKRLRLATPVRDAESGAHRIEEHEVEGPIALLYSSTKTAIHFENATRCFLLSLNESPEQTTDIHRAQRLARTAGGLGLRAERDALRALHRNVQRLLDRVVVVNPFAERLTFPSQPLEMRRENEKYLSLIDALALLHQHQRVRGTLEVGGRQVAYVEAAAADVRQANRLMTEVLRQGGDELAGPSRRLLELVRGLVEDRARATGAQPETVRFTRRDIREHTGWSDSQIKAHIGQLEDLELLLKGKAVRGAQLTYRLSTEAGGRRALPALTDPDDLPVVRKSEVVCTGLVTADTPISAGKTEGTPESSLKV